VKVPQNTIELAIHFEGGYFKPYLCPAGFWTIGYGHLCDKDHPPIDKAQAEAYLAADLQDALGGTIRTCPILLMQREPWLGAIVDFVFNLGVGRLQASTLRRKINQSDWSAVIYELKKWVYGGGRVLPGLVKRRQAEAAFFQ
jgi:lysozyme